MLRGDNQRMLQETKAMITQKHFMFVIMLNVAWALGGPPPALTHGFSPGCATSATFNDSE